MSGAVRVRFAPSPTGYLHVGGARTAFFNWLFVRSEGGSFILRIEDTDVARSTQESLQAILESMRWLGMDWDEGPGKDGAAGPYFQSQRMEKYREFSSRLLASGHAYRCFCTREELEDRRAASLAEKGALKYDGRCERLSPEEVLSLEAGGRPCVVRFRVRSGVTSWQDEVKGRIEFSNSELDDFIITRSNGTPTYNFAAVVDDVTMQITHVIRGDEHISNTPRQILLYEALGEALPVFAHLPMILGPDGTKLSKRHGAVAISHYERQGFLPEAMANFLALLGWAYDGKREIFTREELVRKFSLERVSSNPSVFDQDKLIWMNGQYMRELPSSRRHEMVRRFLREEEGMNDVDTRGDWIDRIVDVVGDRMKVASQITELAGFFFEDRVRYDEKARELLLSGAGTSELLLKVAGRLESLKDYGAVSIEEAIRGLAGEMGLKAGELIHPARAALTGKTTSPGIFDVMTLLGRERCLSRLRDAADFAASERAS
ncbi:MAG: glutamate--tRNA ligase [Candidatus Eiseniibacteriota bacterium]|nr:MAG: glutamate--tRNA ligase [Candidatus Eisenbacteria bacterium]